MRWGVLLAAALWVGCDDEAEDPPAPAGTESAFARTHGFQFPNYGNVGVVNLTPLEMTRLFGARVCAAGEGATCTLTPNADRWMNRTNARMGGGHCFGMAAATLLFLEGALDPAAFGMGDAGPAELALTANEPLQRELAYLMALQTVPEVTRQDVGSWGTKATPREVVDHLEAGLAAGQRFVLGFDRRTGGGHAVVVIDVAEGAAPDTRHVIVYDSNFPGRETTLIVDRAANTWRYDHAATRPDVPPDVWEGDAQTFSLSALAVSALQGLDPARTTCPTSVCEAFDPGGARRTLTTVGDFAQVLVTDGAGRRFGDHGGERFREIPDASAQVFRGGLWDDTAPPELSLRDDQYTVTLASPDPDTPAEVWWEGPGFALGVVDIFLGPDVEDQITVAQGRARLEYETTEAETAVVVLGAVTDVSDWEFELQSAGDDLGQVIEAELDMEQGVLFFSFDDFEASDRSATFDLLVDRLGDDGECLLFEHRGVQVPYGAEVAIPFGEWDDGLSLVMEVDLEGDGFDADDPVIELTDDG